MFRLNLSQTLVLVYQEVSKAGHKMHILALMCTTKGYKMLTKGDNATQSMLIFVQLNIFYALSKQISEETWHFFQYICCSRRDKIIYAYAFIY